MIARIAGLIDKIEDNAVIVMVGAPSLGVAVRVFASAKTLQAIGNRGDYVSLLTELQVREDSLTLFGFASEAEQFWFRLLTSVQGVGARVAMAILGTLTPDALQLAIAAQDKAMLGRADGVGPKLAIRILTELKDKAAKAIPVAISYHDIMQSSSQANAVSPSSGYAHPEHFPLAADAISALVHLGYGRSEAMQAVYAVTKTMDTETASAADLSQTIRLALRELALDKSASGKTGS